jgi:Na+/melibiose symporter-like transporter
MSWGSSSPPPLTLSDRMVSRWGRRHPFLFASALPLPFFFYLTFAPPAGLSDLQLFVWLTVSAVLTRGSQHLTRHLCPLRPHTRALRRDPTAPSRNAEGGLSFALTRGA